MQRGETPAGRRAAANAVRRQRAVKHYTQQELAEAAGVGRRTIQHLEAGDQVPTLEKLIAIEQALGWPPGHLLEMIENGQAKQADTWRDVRRMLLHALGTSDLDQMRDAIADALVALGGSEDQPGPSAGSSRPPRGQA